MKKDSDYRSAKWPIIVFSIPLFLLVLPLFILLIVWAEGYFVFYVDNLKFWQHKFTTISGEPYHLDQESYHVNKVEINNYSPLFAEFPDDSSEYGVDYFFFGEKIKPSHNSFYDRFELYISCKWDKQDYEFEKERLSSLVGGDNFHPLFSNDLFPFPSYVFIYEHGSFLYALLDEKENTIIYIAINEIGSIKDVMFDHSLAPQKSLYKSDLAKQTTFGSFHY